MGSTNSFQATDLDRRRGGLALGMPACRSAAVDEVHAEMGSRTSAPAHDRQAIPSTASPTAPVSVPCPWQQLIGDTRSPTAAELAAHKEKRPNLELHLTKSVPVARTTAFAGEFFRSQDDERAMRAASLRTTHSLPGVLGAGAALHRLPAVRAAGTVLASRHMARLSRDASAKRTSPTEPSPKSNGVSGIPCPVVAPASACAHWPAAPAVRVHPINEENKRSPSPQRRMSTGAAVGLGGFPTTNGHQPANKELEQTKSAPSFPLGRRTAAFAAQFRR